MIVVADASPLNYLIQIECASVLQKLFSRVLIPVAVIDELRHPGAPSPVATWVKNIPEWIEIRALTSQPDPALEVLDVLLAAGRRGLIDAESAYQRLVTETTFRALRERFLRICHEDG